MCSATTCNMNKSQHKSDVHSCTSHIFQRRLLNDEIHGDFGRAASDVRHGILEYGHDRGDVDETSDDVNEATCSNDNVPAFRTRGKW